MADRRALVVGGGIAGLVAALDLAESGYGVTVQEASNRWGGKIWSSPVGDRLVDAGPDSILARVDEGRALCERLGLGHTLTHPVAKIPAFIHAPTSGNGPLSQLPVGTVLGVPTDLAQLEGIISPAGIEAAAADLSLPWSPPTQDVSVGEVCRARLGNEVTDRLIDPLLGGINASDIDHLSLQSAAPQLAAALRSTGSLITGLAKLRASSGPGLGSTKPVFYGLEGGVAQIIDRLVERLEAAGADLRLASPVAALGLEPPSSRQAHLTVLAVPAFAAAKLLAPVDPDAAAELSAIEYASVAQVTVEFPIDAVAEVLDTSGILFPRIDGKHLTACTWLSSKWQHYQRPDTILLRLTSGRYGDERVRSLDDDTLTATLLGDLRSVVPVEGEPLARRVQRWDRSLPQYAPGHGERVANARRHLDEGETGIVLAGAAYDGIGIPACIRSGTAAATQAIALDTSPKAGREIDR